MIKFFTHKKTALIASAVSGIMTAFSFSDEKFFFVIFFALIPLFLPIIILKPDRKGLSGLVFSYTAAYHFTLILWMYELNDVIKLEIGRFSIPAITICILLISAIMGGFAVLATLPFTSLRCGNAWDIVIFSFLFILGEYLGGILPFFSFPWGRIGVIATPFTQYIQSASLFGVLFVSLITVMINGFAALWLTDMRKPAPIIAATLVFAVNTGFGTIRQAVLENNYSPDKTAILTQANYAGIEKWAVSSDEVMYSYLMLISDRLSPSVTLAVMPETAVPVDFSGPNNLRSTLIDFAKANNITIVTGVLNRVENKTYNSIVAISPDGSVSKPYSKQRLVPIGEYLPFSDIVAKLIPDIYELAGFYTKGAGNAAIESDAGKICGIICYESIYPEIARGNVRDGSELITIVSNDSWFGDTSALYEHHAHSIMRAIENDRCVLRSSSTAITSMILPWGEVERVAPQLEAASITVEYQLRSTRTLYSLMGDIIVIPSAVLYGAWILRSVKRLGQCHRNK